jgi:hypothetical protein
MDALAAALEMDATASELLGEPLPNASADLAAILGLLEIDETLADASAAQYVGGAITAESQPCALHCPNCNAGIIIPHGQENCRIFICGINIETGQQLAPHDEAGAARLVVAGKVMGCGKQMQLELTVRELVSCTGR